MAFIMKSTELRFPIIHLFDGSTPPVEVDLATAALTYDSSDETICKWEMREADGSVGDATDAGKNAVVAQGASGNCIVHVVVTNLDASVVTLAADFTVSSGGVNVVSGTLDFGPVVAKV